MPWGMNGNLFLYPTFLVCTFKDFLCSSYGVANDHPFLGKFLDEVMRTISKGLIPRFDLGDTDCFGGPLSLSLFSDPKTKGWRLARLGLIVKGIDYATRKIRSSLVPGGLCRSWCSISFWVDVAVSKSNLLGPLVVCAPQGCSSNWRTAWVETYSARTNLRTKGIRYKRKTTLFPQNQLLTSKSFGSLAIGYQRPIALRPTLAGSLPLSTLKSQIFNRVLIILNNKYLSSGM